MNGPPIYLDHNATTPVHPEVVAVMLPCLHDTFGNPSSGHAYGQQARAAVERARGEVASLLGCHPDEIVFTSGGTEANNLAIRGVVERSALADRDIGRRASSHRRAVCVPRDSRLPGGSNPSG